MPEGRHFRTYFILALMPLFFSTNIIFGRIAVASTEPWTLAFIRWFLCALILMPFAASAIHQHFELLKKSWRRLLILGFLGMWICGSLVYLALRYTSATNGTLIYTSSPVLIIFLEWMFRGRRVGFREFLGIIVALIGVLVIIFRGNIGVMLALDFNVGDMLFIFTALSWSIYSVVLKSPLLDQVPTLALFTTIAVFGAATLAPFAIVEIVYTNSFPADLTIWTNIAGIVLFASLIAFGAYQYGVKSAGPSIAGIFMYLLPVYGVAMAVIFLGEEIMPYHIAGIITVSGGVILASFPTTLLSRFGKTKNRGVA